MDPLTDADLQPAVAAEFLALAEVLEPLDEAAWGAPSLCDGWRVREVVAHMTMPVRYSASEFETELRDCDFDFTRLSNLVATRDAALARGVLVDNLRDEALHLWSPPGGGYAGALNHAVIHGLDITVPLGLPRTAPDVTIRSVLDELTSGGGHSNFGFDLSGLQLQATDMDWSYGSGSPVSGQAADIALFLCGRALPEGRIRS
jgi:uncharacterized protein (TIGR03083 family)